MDYLWIYRPEGPECPLGEGRVGEESRGVAVDVLMTVSGSQFLQFERHPPSRGILRERCPFRTLKFLKLGHSAIALGRVQ